jgi:hypothetical protein
MNYKLYTYFSKEECESIVDFCMKNGEPFSYYKDEKDSWDCRRIYDTDFKSMILDKILNTQSFDLFEIKNINVSMTRYYDSRRLDLHLDKTSNYTTVIALTESYNDGRFVLSDTLCELSEANTKINLNIGEGVTFEGNTIYHGVMPVTTGLRCALNIWMNDTDFVYYKLDNQKKLI